MQNESDPNAAPVGLADLLVWIRANWLIIALPAIAFLLLGIAYVVVATPKYKVEALLAPADPPNSGQMLNRLASQFGAANLFGLQSQDAQNLSEVALAVLKSRRFIGQFIERHDLLPVLYASRWDSATGDWVDNGDSPPSLNDGHRLFTESLLSVREDNVTGFITLTLVWSDAEVANHWLTLLIKELNEDIRERERAEARKSLEFLSNELGKTDLTELRQGLYQLSLTELQRLTMSNVREEFALKTIDPPSLPDADDPAYPKKLLVLVGSLSLGLIMGIGIALLLTAWRISGSTSTRV